MLLALPLMRLMCAFVLQILFGMDFSASLTLRLFRTQQASKKRRSIHVLAKMTLSGTSKTYSASSTVSQLTMLSSWSQEASKSANVSASTFGTQQQTFASFTALISSMLWEPGVT